MLAVASTNHSMFGRNVHFADRQLTSTICGGPTFWNKVRPFIFTELNNLYVGVNALVSLYFPDIYFEK